MNDAEPDWRPFPWFLLRATGLPFEWLEGVRDTDDLRRLARRPEVREALSLVDRDLDSRLDAWLDGTDDDPGVESGLWRDLQRVLAQNYCTSRFGPVGAGRLDRVEPADRERPTDVGRRIWVSQWLLERLLARAAADLRAEGGQRERPRRAPGVVVEAGRAVRFEPGARGLEAAARLDDPDDAGLLEQADGGRDPEEIAEAVGRSRADVEARLERLAGEGWWLPWSHLPTGLVDPVATARKRLARQPAGPVRDRWLARLDDLDAAVRAFAGAAGDFSARRGRMADLESRLGAWLGEPPLAGSTELPPSDGLLHEQAARTDEPMGLPASWSARLCEATTPYLDLCLLPVALERLKLRAWFRSRWGDGGADGVPWPEVLDALSRDVVGYEMGAPPEARALADRIRAVKAALRARVDSHLADHGPDVPLRLGPRDAGSDLEAALGHAAGTGRPFANPDLMLGARGEDVTPVLSEGHHNPILTGCLLPPLPMADAVVADLRRWLSDLCGPDLPAIPFGYQHSMVAALPDVGAVALEISGTAARPPDRRAPFAALRARLDAGGSFRFRVRSHAGADLDVAPLTRIGRLQHAAPTFAVTLFDLGDWLSGPDWRPAGDLPRLSWGDLVVHRRSWRVSSEAWADASAPGEAARRLRAACDDALPRFVFATAAGVRKPFLVDLADAPSVGVAARYARREREVTLVEMLPGPEGLWLRSADGRHTSELRMVFAR
ncbi:MAG: hypothetical protein ACQEXJ_19725 [Myxococcota bacterium]